jgi:transcriptional regulator with XRE-family HTH domain
MRIERNKQWWLDRARREGVEVIGAGLVARDPISDSQSVTRAPTPREDARIAFGRFINLMRRQRGFSMERLAEEAELDASELLVIESDVHYIPEPRTVYRLAQTFSVSQQRLMQLAGLSAANDSGLSREAVKFAARSESIQKLSREENAALDAFIAVLSRQDFQQGK